MSKARSRLEELYLRHADGAGRLAYLLTGDQELAQDLVHEAFAKLAGRLQHLRRSDAFSAYLRRTIINLTKAHWRRQTLERKHLKAPANTRVEAPAEPLSQTLRAALNELPHRQRAAIVLRYFLDLSEHETGDMLGCSSGAVKQLTHRAMSQLRATVSKEEMWT